MIAYLKSHDIFDVSIGAIEMPKSNDEKSIWFNNCDIAYGSMCLAIPPMMRYLIDAVEFPSEIWSRLDRAFGQQTKDISTKNWEGVSDISLQAPPVSITSPEDEFIQDEEISKSSTHSIRICESLLHETPSAATVEVFEKFDVSCFHADALEEDI